MNITIYTFTHKPFTPPPDNLYVPLQVGSALHDDFGYLMDNTGDSISEQNPYFSELTGLYWIWKNDTTSEYVGCAHYRRYLVNENDKLYTKQELSKLLSQYDIITTKLLTLPQDYFTAFNDRHNSQDLVVLGEVIKDICPSYYPAYHSLVHQNRTYFGNMIITSKTQYDKYMSFLFPILFECQKRIDMTGYDTYQKRLFGFFSEFLLYVYLSVHPMSVYESQVGMVCEKIETKELKTQLIEYFKKQDIIGARNYFTKYYTAHPDILMEASDINHELRLAMQAISSMEWEQKYGFSIRLSYISDFHKLIDYYNQLNQFVNLNHTLLHTLLDSLPLNADSNIYFPLFPKDLQQFMALHFTNTIELKIALTLFQ